MKSIFHSIVIKGKQSDFEMDSPWVRRHELSEMKSIASVGTSLVVQGLRLCLAMQGVQVHSLVWELTSHMPSGQKHRT